MTNISVGNDDLIEILDIDTEEKPDHSAGDDTNFAVGIDLGTTNSLIACSTNSNPEIIINEEGTTAIPSVVLYENSSVTVGTAAINNEDSVYSIKRIMGKSYNELTDEQKLLFAVKDEGPKNALVKIKVGENITATPVEISGQILNTLKKSAEKHYNKTVNKVVITVPAYFNDNERQATKLSAQLAGLEVLRLINEPTAAAVAYGLESEGEGIYAIYDLGGGTFDISILKFTKGVFKVLAIGGNTTLGGDDLDYQFMNYIIAKYSADYTPTTQEKKSLLRIAKIAKEGLTYNEACKINFTIDGKQIMAFLKTEDLNIAINNIVEETISIMKNTIEQAEINNEDIKNVILVGGSTRTKIFKDRISEIFGKQKILDHKNPEEVVVMGAAIQAENLVKRTGNNLLIDVVPLSLGIETVGGLVEKIIMRNTPIPSIQSETFTTYKDYQTKIKIHICQGEYDIISKNISLATIILSDIPPMPAGEAKIKINFTIDADGLLTVSASEEISGVKQEIEIKPTHDLTEEKIFKILSAPYKENIESIIKEKQLIKIKLIAEQKINNIEKLLKLEDNNSDDCDLVIIKEKIAILRKSMLSNDYSEIENKLSNLENISKDVLLGLTERYLCNTVVGKDIRDFE